MSGFELVRKINQLQIKMNTLFIFMFSVFSYFCDFINIIFILSWWLSKPVFLQYLLSNLEKIDCFHIGNDKKTEFLVFLSINVHFSILLRFET